MTLFDVPKQISYKQELPVFHDIPSLVEYINLIASTSNEHYIEFIWKKNYGRTYYMSWEQQKELFGELFEYFNEKTTGFKFDTHSSSFTHRPLSIQFRQLTYWVYFLDDLPVWFEHSCSGTDYPPHSARIFPTTIPVKWGRFEKINF